MINIYKINNNKIKLEYNTDKGVIKEELNYKPLKIVKDSNGDFIDLNGTNKYLLNSNGSEYAFNCLVNEKYEKDNYYLNTILQLDKELLYEITFPKVVFYDIETNEYATSKKEKDKVLINSIAWIDENNNKYCLIRGIDGNEHEIIERFINYLQRNNIMGLVGHNSFNFDNKVLIDRMKNLNFDFDKINIFYSQCNLDTMILASFLQYSSSRYISLNELANKLNLDESKINTGTLNPISLYNEALKDDNKLELFKKYNIQDVRLTKMVFECMDAKKQLIELYNQTLCPFSKVQYNQELLNSYTCKEALASNILIPSINNPKIDFKNEEGFNYYKESNKLQVYKNIAVLDVVSYYPHY